MSTQRAYIGVGSNIEAEANIRRALELLCERAVVKAVSPFYRSLPVGTAGQPDFINGIFMVESGAPPRALKYELLRRLEEKLGRVRTADKNAARPIDLDLLLYGDLALREPGLVIPDPGVRRYPFAAVPLLSLAPGLVLPDTGERLEDLFPRPPEAYGLSLLARFSKELGVLLEKH